MKTLVCFLLLAALSGNAADNIAGKWSGSMSVSAPSGQNQEVALVLVLKRSGSELTGTITPAGKEPVPIQKGRVEGDKVSFEIQGANPSMKFDGKLSGSNLNFRVEGTVRVNDEDRQIKGTLELTREQ